MQDPNAKELIDWLERHDPELAARAKEEQEDFEIVEDVGIVGQILNELALRFSNAF